MGKPWKNQSENSKEVNEKDEKPALQKRKLRVELHSLVSKQAIMKATSKVNQAEAIRDVERHLLNENVHGCALRGLLGWYCCCCECCGC